MLHCRKVDGPTYSSTYNPILITIIQLFLIGFLKLNSLTAESFPLLSKSNYELSTDTIYEMDLTLPKKLSCGNWFGKRADAANKVLINQIMDHLNEKVVG